MVAPDLIGKHLSVLLKAGSAASFFRVEAADEVLNEKSKSNTMSYISSSDNREHPKALKHME